MAYLSNPIKLLAVAITLSATPIFAFAGDENLSETNTETEGSQEATATLAGGCFWCTEAVFERMQGVKDVVSGYIGGTVPNPTYEQVCSKKTGHAEAIEIIYDPSQTTYEELLEVFFKTHDPTTKNKQGADEGPQYRKRCLLPQRRAEEVCGEIHCQAERIRRIQISHRHYLGKSHKILPCRRVPSGLLP